MPRARREFQIFAKPGSRFCNFGCGYCYYLGKADELTASPPRMSDEMLETYIVQHLEAHPGQRVGFSWHGGEPTLLGLDFFRRVVSLQKRHLAPGRRATNGLQTNAALLDDEWCRFLAAESFSVGVSLDGPARLHDLVRRTKAGEPSHHLTIRGWELLGRHGVTREILCVVGAHNVEHSLEVYRFLKDIGAGHVGFLPLVIPSPDGGVDAMSTPAKAFGEFLRDVFDEWAARDIGRVKVQIFEEAARVAFGQDHSLCVCRPTCGDIPVVESNGDVYSCDHFVDAGHLLGNIGRRHLAELIDDPAQRAFGRAKRDSLPRACRQCEVRDMCHGGCPKDRFLDDPAGEGRLNYLCAGYRLFFGHCRPFVEAVARQWRGEAALPAPPAAHPAAGPGRNDPCPCGSGRKYKKCCLPGRART